jgi:hypothetical protein
MSEHIKIGNVTPRTQYVGDGESQVFVFSFPIFADDDLEVYFNEVRQGSGFTIQGAASSEGGSVTFASPPPSGVIVTLRRHLSLQRLSDFQESGKLRAKILNDELDYQTAALQQIAEGLSRTVQAAPTSPDMDLTFPDLPSGSVGYLRFDGTTRTLGVAELTAAGVTTRFRDLSDTPNSYEGDGGKVLAVNEDGTGSIVAVSLGAVALDIDGLGLQATIEAAADTVPVFDESAGINVKATAAVLVQAALDAGATLPVHGHTGAQVTVTGTPGHGLRIAADNTIETTGEVPGSGGGGGITDHGALTGLADDDHTQYHTDTRGDARYYLRGTIDGFLAGKADSSHSQAISTVTGLQSALDAKAAAARQVATTHSLTGGGDLSADRTLSLIGDAASPGNSKYYGTDGGGAKGFHDLPTGSGSGDVASVFGRTGAVVAQSGDYDASEITETADAKIMTAAERTKLAGIATGANLYTHPDHSGDVVSSGDGTTMIQSGVVTYAKMQSVTAARLLGRGSAGGSGAPQEISLGSNISLDGTTLNVSSGTATLGDGVYGDITVSGSGTVMTVDPAILGGAGLTRATYTQPTGAQTWPTVAQTAKHWIVTMATSGTLTIHPQHFPWTDDLTEEMLLTVIQPASGMRQPVIDDLYATPFGGYAAYFREVANSRTTMRFWKDESGAIFWDGWNGTAGRLIVGEMDVQDFIYLPENSITATNQIDPNAKSGSGGKLVTANGGIISGLPVVGAAGGDVASGAIATVSEVSGEATLVGGAHTFITGAATGAGYTLPAIGTYGNIVTITNRHSASVSVNRAGTDTITLVDGTAAQTSITIPAETTVTLAGESGVWHVEAAGSGGSGGPVTGQDVTITPFVAGNAVVLDANGHPIDGGVPPGGVGGTTNITVVESPTGVEIQSSSGTNDSIALATDTNAGVMAPADKTKLDGVASGANAYTHPNHTGDVTSVGDGATTIVNDAVTNAKLSNMAESRIKGRQAAGGTGDPEDLTPAQARTAMELGTAATQNVGQSAGNVVQLDGSGRLPAVDGSQLTNLPGGGVSGDATINTPAEDGNALRTMSAAADLNGRAAGDILLRHANAQYQLAPNELSAGQRVRLTWTNAAPDQAEPIILPATCTAFPAPAVITSRFQGVEILAAGPTDFRVRSLPGWTQGAFGDPEPDLDPPGDFTEYFHPFNQGGTTYLTHADGTRYAEGLSGVKKALILIAATWADPAALQRHLLSVTLGASYIGRSSSNLMISPWADTAGAVLATSSNATMFGAAVPNSSRAHFLVSIDNELGSYKMHQLLFREAQGFARANATFKNVTFTGTDQPIRLQDVARSGDAQALILGAGNLSSGSPHVGGIGRVTVWPEIAPDLSAWDDTDLANLWNTTTGALVDPTVAHTAIGTPALDLVGTASADWTNQAGEFGIWGNMVGFN